MNHRISRSLAAAALGIAWVASLATPAGAHTGHEEGDLEMVVGFGTEPAYAGQPNSVQLLLRHGGEPLTRLPQPPDVEVSFGDETMALELEPFFGPGFGQPGDYRAWFIPTDPGQYTFRFRGTIEGQEIDESFTSGPDTFGDVQDPSAISFPSGEVPTNAELAERIEREVPRLGSQIDELGAGIDRSLRAAEEEAAGARTFGVIGMAVGALGLVVGGLALASARRRG